MNVVGSFAAPARIAMIVVTRMLITSEPRTLSAYSANVMTRPMMKTNWAAVVG